MSSKCLTVETGDSASGGKNGLTLEEEQAFTEAFPANLVDVSLGLNVFGTFLKQACVVVCAMLLAVYRSSIFRAAEDCERSARPRISYFLRQLVAP